MDTSFRSGDLTLRAHVARLPESRGSARVPGLVLCHGFPSGPRGAATSAQTYPQLADRIAQETGLVVLAFNFRGAGGSEGQFSLAGWLDDLRAAIDHLLTDQGVDDVWLAGFSTGGALAICAAGEDERVRGVVGAAAPADFHEWAASPRRFLDHVREVGVVTDPAFPPDLEAWARELREIRPTALIAKIPPRPILLIHGSDDDAVPVSDARVLADASHASAELRIVSSAGHRLRHDPRAMALLLGWLQRHAA